MLCHVSSCHDCTHPVMITSCYVVMSHVIMSWLYSFSHDHVTLCLCVMSRHVTRRVSSCHDCLYPVMTMCVSGSSSHDIGCHTTLWDMGSDPCLSRVTLCPTWGPWVVTLSVTWLSLSWDMGYGPYLSCVIRPSCPLSSSECLGPFHGFDLKCPFAGLSFGSVSPVP